MDSNRRVVVDGLSVRLDASPIVSDANLTVDAGELVGIVGPRAES
jgi:ABC-type Mn2+/Zn2+ transport system ATPase subunit